MNNNEKHDLLTLARRRSRDFLLYSRIYKKIKTLYVMHNYKKARVNAWFINGLTLTATRANPNRNYGRNTHMWVIRSPDIDV